MSDSTIPEGGSQSGWRQEGSGSHPTLAGNRLDPNVGSQGGVDPSQSGVHQEGIDHIKGNVGETTHVGGGLGSSAGTTDTTSGLGSSTGHSGTSSGLTGGLTGGSSGVDSTTYNETPGVSGEQQNTGIIGTVKSYLGYGDQPADRNVDETSASGYESGTTAGAGLAGAGAGSALSGRDTSDSSNVPSSLTDRDSTTGTSSSLTGSSTTGNVAAGGLSSDNSSTGATTSQKDPAAQAAPRETPTDSDVTSGAKPTESADPHTDDRAMTNKEEKREEGESAKEHDKGKSEASTGSKRINESSIPTAGGERLGEKHWGESKIVPDNPKPKEGVSSEDGQPTDETRENTSANTGGAHPPGQHGKDGEGKEGLVDKIKDKLHMGHKDK